MVLSDLIPFCQTSDVTHVTVISCTDKRKRNDMAISKLERIQDRSVENDQINVGWRERGGLDLMRSGDEEES